MAPPYSCRPPPPARRSVVQPFAQDLLGMLPEQRRRQPDRARLAINLPGRADLVDLARRWMLDLQAHVARRRERTGERFLDVENGPGGNRKLLEACQPPLSRVLFEVAFDRADQCGPRPLSLGVGREPWIVRQLRRTDGLAESRVLRIRRDRHIDEAVADRERPVRGDRGVVVAFLLRDLARCEVTTGLVGEEREQRVVERDVDMPAFASG